MANHESIKHLIQRLEVEWWNWIQNCPNQIYANSTQPGLLSNSRLESQVKQCTWSKGRSRKVKDGSILHNKILLLVSPNIFGSFMPLIEKEISPPNPAFSLRDERDPSRPESGLFKNTHCWFVLNHELTADDIICWCVLLHGYWQCHHVIVRIGLKQYITRVLRVLRVFYDNKNN